jgi:hypothetical protein
MGGAWAREDIPWHVVERVKGQFTWDNTDAAVSALRTNNLNVLGILGYSVDWATTTTADDGGLVESLYPPKIGDFENYVRAVVTRYKDRGVHHWEIWNEPNNNDHWLPLADGRVYGELLKAAYRVIQQVDPNAKVLSGGVTGNAISFLDDMISAGALDSFDILAIHCYAVPAPAPDETDPRTQARPEVHKMVEVELAKYRAFLQRHGRGNRAIWVTEMGWPADEWGPLGDDLQADYLAQAYAQMLSYDEAERIFWYSLKDDSGQPKTSYGLIAWGSGKSDLYPLRASFAAYKTIATMLAGTEPAGRTPPDSFLDPFTLVEGFEQTGDWTRRPPMTPGGSLERTSNQKRSGSYSGQLRYEFTGLKQSIDFAPPQPATLPGNPTRLGVWVLGDASGNYLSAWLKDKDGDLFKVRFGAVRASTDGWQYYEARINNYYFKGETYPEVPGRVAMPKPPLKLDAFRLSNFPDQPPSSGAIYIDDLQSYTGPDVTAARFTRSNNSVVDVLWSVQGTQVKLRTGSSSAQVTNRNGETRTVTANQGVLSLDVGHSPIYVLHEPATTQLPPPTAIPPTQSTPTPGVQPPIVTVTATKAPGSSETCKALAPAQPATYPDNRYFPNTKHNLHGAFRRYWEQHGSIAILGYPITEEFVDVSTDGRPYTQQYFERARMEYHPQNAPPYDVLLGLMGVTSTEGSSFPTATSTQSNNTTIYFPETRHSLSLFRNWWTPNGGLPVFGYPISEEMQEISPTDGKTYTVQYFQRNRLEHNPQFAGTNNEVLLGLLGSEWLRQRCP